MVKRILIFTAVFAAANVLAQTPDFSLMGFASLEGEGVAYNKGGTTGGMGGQVVVPKSFDELKLYVEEPSAPYLIYIDREFTTEKPCLVDTTSGHLSSGGASSVESTYGEILKVGSNKSIIGVCDKAFFNRIGLNIQTQSNVIIKNVKFTMRHVPIDKSGENKIVALRDGVEVLAGDPDCVSIQADFPSASENIASHHIWVDHCEFYNGWSPNTDRYDGLLDMKNNVKYVTISWCYFHDHKKSCLSGKGNSDNYDRLVTMHHNYFHKIEGSRLPLQRFGHYHYLNNYQNGCEDGYDLRIKSNGYVEGCYFKDTKSPIKVKASEGGRVTIVDAVFAGCSNLPKGFSNVDGAKVKSSFSYDEADFKPSDFYSYVADEAESVPALLEEWCGVGKIGCEPDFVPDETTETECVDVEMFKVFADGLRLFIEGATDEVAVFDVCGNRLFEGSGESLMCKVERSGVYLVRSGKVTVRVLVP